MTQSYPEDEPILEYSHTPPKASTIGMWLFLAALTMLFAASLLGYLMIRLGMPNSPGRGVVTLPNELWLSTALVIGVSIALWRAVETVRREKLSAFRTWLTLSLLLGTGFIVVQTPALVQLMQAHRHQLALAHTAGQAPSAAAKGLYGLIFVLILLHALHVVGGVIALVTVAVRGYHNAYDHEHFLPVKHAALYWHFLDIVWIVLFSTFWLTR